MASESTLPPAMSIELIDLLVKADVIGGSVSRCIIDAEYGKPLRIIAQHNGDQRTIGAVVDVLCGVTGDGGPSASEDSIPWGFKCTTPDCPGRASLPGLDCPKCYDLAAEADKRRAVRAAAKAMEKRVGAKVAAKLAEADSTRETRAKRAEKAWRKLRKTIEACAKANPFDMNTLKYMDSLIPPDPEATATEVETSQETRAKRVDDAKAELTKAKAGELCVCPGPQSITGRWDGFSCGVCGRVIDFKAFTRFMQAASIAPSVIGDANRYVSSGLADLLRRAGR